MTILERLRNKQPLFCAFCEWALVILLIVSIVWRGGKSLDMTWVLTGISMMALIVSYIRPREDGNGHIPLLLWAGVIGLIVLTTLSFFTSTTQNYGFDEVLRTAALGMVFFWVIRKVGSKKQDDAYVMRMLRVLGFTTVGACFLGILVYVFQPVNRFVGTFFDYRFQTDYWPNAWAQFLLLAWPIVLFLALKDFTYDPKKASSRIEFLMRNLIVGFVIGCLFLSYSRGAILVFGLQLLLWAGIVYGKTRPQFPIRSIVPITFVVGVVSFSTFIAINTMRSQIYDVQDVGAKVTFTAEEGTSSVSERRQFWQQALVLSVQRPLLGWGPYSFRFVQPSLQEHILATSDHPHNVFLKILMERGVVSLLCFILIIGFILFRASVQLLSKHTELASLLFSLRMFLFLGVAGVLLHNLIDYNLQFVGIALPFWIFLGILTTYIDISSLRPVPPRLAKYVELSIAIVVLVVAVYEGGYLVVTSLGRHAEAVGDTETALLWYGRADGEIFTRDLHLSRAKLFVERSEYDKAQEAVETYMTRNDQDYRAWKQLGAISLLSGYKQNALGAYRKAYERGKYNDIGVLRGVLEAHLALDDKDAITAMLPEIHDLMTQYATAIQNNAHFIALSPNAEEFIFLANMLSRLYPEEAPRYQVMAAKVDHHAQIERARIEARAPGFLW